MLERVEVCAYKALKIAILDIMFFCQPGMEAPTAKVQVVLEVDSLVDKGL